MVVIKSLTKISFYKILINKFQIYNLCKSVQPQHRIPINKFFEELNFIYETDPTSSTLHRKKNWFKYVILVILVSNILRNLVYTFFNSNDQKFRLFCGDLIQFAVEIKEVSYVTITMVGSASYATAMFCLFHYSSVNQLKWFNIFNAIEGKQSFVKSKILMTKSGKKLIRLSLFLFIFSIIFSRLSTITSTFILTFVTIQKLSFENFLFSLPWNILTDIWAFYAAGYIFASLFITIICYYHQLRFNQLDVYVNWLLKLKHFKFYNQRIKKVLNEYTEIITEVNQFNKFASKVLFYLFLFNALTIVFIVYNLIYVKLTTIAMFGHYVVATDILSLIGIIILNAIRIPNQLEWNKRNLNSLIYKKNLFVKTKIKVNYNLSTDKLMKLCISVAIIN